MESKHSVWEGTADPLVTLVSIPQVITSQEGIWIHRDRKRINQIYQSSKVGTLENWGMSPKNSTVPALEMFQIVSALKSSTKSINLV